MTPTQIKELQDALNGIAGDPAYHLKVIVLPPGSKVDPQRPVDLSDGFDLLVQTQVAMAFDVTPIELGILPNIGSGGAGGGANSSAVRFGAQEARDLKTRKSTKPLLMFLCDIFNYVLQDICGQQDMQFAFEGLVDDEDKQQITSLGVEQVQNGISSIDEVRERLDMAPWGLQETSEPVVFTAQGPIPFSMAPQLIAAMQGAGPAGGQGTNSGQRTPSSRSRTSQPSVRRAGQTKPNGSHQAPLAPHRENPTPAARRRLRRHPVPDPAHRGNDIPLVRGRVAEEGCRGGTRRSRPSPAQGPADLHVGSPAHPGAGTGDDLRGRREGCPDRHRRRARRGHLPQGRGQATRLGIIDDAQPQPRETGFHLAKSVAHWPGWERDLGLVGAYKQQISQAFHDAESRGSDLRKKAATGGMFVSQATLRDLICDEVRDVFGNVLTPLWTEAWHLGYQSAKSLVTGLPADFTAKDGMEHLPGSSAPRGSTGSPR